MKNINIAKDVPMESQKKTTRTITYYRTNIKTKEVDTYTAEVDNDPSVRFASLAGFMSVLLFMNKIQVGSYQWWAEKDILGI